MVAVTFGPDAAGTVGLPPALAAGVPAATGTAVGGVVGDCCATTVGAVVGVAPACRPRSHQPPTLADAITTTSAAASPAQISAFERRGAGAGTLGIIE